MDPGMAYVWMFRLPQGNNDIIENDKSSSISVSRRQTDNTRVHQYP
jgi:hypothetical protein